MNKAIPECGGMDSQQIGHNLLLGFSFGVLGVARFLSYSIPELIISIISLNAENYSYCVHSAFIQNKYEQLRTLKQ